MKQLEQDICAHLNIFMAARKVLRLFQMRWGLRWREWVRSQRDNDAIVIQQKWQQMRKKFARRNISNWDLAGEASAWSCPTNHISLILYKEYRWKCEKQNTCRLFFLLCFIWRLQFREFQIAAFPKYLVIIPFKNFPSVMTISMIIMINVIIIISITTSISLWWQSRRDGLEAFYQRLRSSFDPSWLSIGCTSHPKSSKIIIIVIIILIIIIIIKFESITDKYWSIGVWSKKVIGWLSTKLLLDFRSRQKCKLVSYIKGLPSYCKDINSLWAHLNISSGKFQDFLAWFLPLLPLSGGRGPTVGLLEGELDRYHLCPFFLAIAPSACTSYL